MRFGYRKSFLRFCGNRCSATGAEKVPNFGAGAADVAFEFFGCSLGWMVSLMTSTGALPKVTGIFRCTSRLTVASSCLESSA